MVHLNNEQSIISNDLEPLMVLGHKSDLENEPKLHFQANENALHNSCLCWGELQSEKRIMRPGS